MNDNVVVFVGGVGGAKLAYGLSQVVPPEKLTVVVNTGDDFWHYGLRICPDLDTITYTLAGVVNRENGWGVAGDTFAMLGALREHFQEDTWFGLGDKDLATHLLRTQALHAGETLTAITQRLTQALGIACTVLPMTDDEVATRVDTVEHGEIDFQTYFVRYRWQPTITALRLDGIETASISGAVQAALAKADVILLGPSNPWLSIAPILSLPGMQETLQSRNVPRVAISPVVGGKAIKGPTVKLMKELGYDQTATAVAAYYGVNINGFVYDAQDDAVALPNVRVTSFNTVMKSDADKVEVAKRSLEWIRNWD